MRSKSFLASLVLCSFASETDHFKESVRRALLTDRDRFTYLNKTFGLRKEGEKVKVFEILSPEEHSPSSTSVSTSTERQTRVTMASFGPLVTALLVLTPKSVDAGLWDSATEPSDFEVGQKFTKVFCDKIESEKCTKLRKSFLIPPAAPQPTADSAVTAHHVTAHAVTAHEVTVPSPVGDPCKRDLGCLNWSSYRKRILVPFVKQLQTTRALGRFEDDQVQGSIFSREGFKAFYESQTLPADSQVIGAESAAVQSLKLLFDCLSQIRSMRVEQYDGSGANWTDLVALPGCVVLLIYMSILLTQIKTFWKKKLLQAEEDKAQRLLQTMMKAQASQDLPPPHQSVAINMPRLVMDSGL